MPEIEPGTFCMQTFCRSWRVSNHTISASSIQLPEAPAFMERKKYGLSLTLAWKGCMSQGTILACTGTGRLNSQCYIQHMLGAGWGALSWFTEDIVVQFTAFLLCYSAYEGPQWYGSPPQASLNGINPFIHMGSRNHTATQQLAMQMWMVEAVASI